MTGQMTGHADRPSRIPWPPIVAVVGIAAGIVLGRIVPLGWPLGTGADILQGAGGVLIVGAALIAAAALQAMRKAHTTVRPDAAASHLVTTGPFSFTRNPLYLATAIFIVGLALVLGNIWLLAAAVAVALADQKLAIEPEEAHLEARFGKSWREYRKRVRRWI